MATYDAGDARLKIFPDASEFKKRLEADLAKINVDFKVQVHPNTAQASADLERWRQQQQRNGIDIPVRIDERQATESIRRTRGEVDKLGAVLERLAGAPGSGGGFKFNFALAGIGELPAAALAISSVTGAIQQLAGAGLALPGVIGGVAATIGTVKLGLNGVSDAYKALDKAADGTAKSTAAANKALDALAPSAADAVRTAHDLAGQITKELGKPIQGNLFEGISDDLKNLNSSLLPSLKTGLGGISTALNGDLRQALQSLGSDSSKGILDRILGNTAAAETKFQAAIDPIIHGIGTLVASSSNVLPRLADDVGKAFGRFDKFISAADQDGTLEKFINGGIDGVEHLGSSFVNVGKILNDVTQAAGSGDGLLATLDDATGRLDAFLKSTEGQNQLKAYFAEGKQILADDIVPLLKSLPGFLQGVAAAGHDIAETVIPPLRDMATFLGEHKTLIEGVVVAFGAWKGITGVASLITDLQKISTLLGGIGGGAGVAAGGAGAAGAGGRLGGLLNKLGPAALLAGGGAYLGDSLLAPSDGSDPSTLGALGGAAANIGGFAGAGALVGGPVGAAAGALLGTVVSVFETATRELNQGKAAFEAQWEADHNNPNRPGNPDAANAATGRDRILTPSVFGPDGAPKQSTGGELAAQIAAGKLPGYSLGPNGAVIGPNGQTLNVPGVNVAAPPKPAPAPPPPPAPVQTYQGSPFPVAPPAAPAAAPAPANYNPITGPTTIAAKVDPNAQASVEKLATSIQSLPEGKVAIQDGSPQVLESVKRLDTTVTQLKDHPGEVIVTANTADAQTKLDALIRGYQNRMITVLLNPQTSGGGLPVAPGHAKGGVLPGYSPGVDNMLVPMSGGEGVLTPPITRALGGPAGIDAINRGALTRGFAGGGVTPLVDANGNPITAGPAPGPPPAGPAPIAANPAGGGGFGDVLGSIASGISGPIGNAIGLGQAAAGAAGAPAGPPSALTDPGLQTQHGVGTLAPPPSAAAGSAPGSLADRFASIPGLFGLFGSAASSDPSTNLTNWGQKTGEWLGNFTAKTVGSFATTLWSGALGAVGLENSILSPNNPWFQAAQQGAGFALGSNGPIGTALGGGSGSTSKPASATQLRTAGEKVTKADQKVAQIQQKIAELKPNASASSRQSLADQLANARQDAIDARSDLDTLRTGGGSASTTKSREAAQKVAKADQQVALIQSKISELKPNAKGSARQSLADQLTNAQQAAADARADLGVLSGTSSSTSTAVDPNAPVAPGFADGGVLPGYSPGHDNLLVPMSGGEGVIVPTVTRQLGKAGIDAINRGALTKGFAFGGITPIPLGAIPAIPGPIGNDQARTINTPPPAPSSPAPGGHAQLPNVGAKQLPGPIGGTPAPGAPPTPAAPPPPGPPPAPQQQAPSYTPTTAQLPVSTVSGNPADHLDHNLAAINTGIDSAAQAIGQAASTAIGIAGSSGFSPGAGAIGPYVAGLIQEGGKVVKDVVNVGSSFLVGTVTPGTTPSQYGDTLTAPQNVPNTATDNRRNYTFNGVDGARIVDDIRLKDAQDSQGTLAPWRG